jgi:hypothetical protein
MSKLLDLLTYPHSYRRAVARFLIRRFELFSYEQRLDRSLVDRPHYGHCIYVAARLARSLGHRRLSVIEFGVAGGNGLLAAERHAREITRVCGVEIDLYGFDSGAGLPPPSDYRDLPYQWKPGFFRMDASALMPKLSVSKVILGDVRETVAAFCDEHEPAPIGCVFNDLDYYSSTRDSFALFDSAPRFFLPRVMMYFDDIIGDEISLYSEFSGERLAIREFNDTQSEKKIGRCHHLAVATERFTWHQQIFALHWFTHPDYNRFVSAENQQLTLQG